MNSIVLEEFFKIAEDSDLLGLKKTAAPERNPYKEKRKVVEQKRLDAPEKSIMEIAHPEPVYVAEARGDGGLVENEIENQRKIIEIINKMPTGSLVGRYAAALNSLIKIANVCDEIEEQAAGDIITNAAIKLLEKIDSLPLK